MTKPEQGALPEPARAHHHKQPVLARPPAEWDVMTEGRQRGVGAGVCAADEGRASGSASVSDRLPSPSRSTASPMTTIGSGFASGTTPSPSSPDNLLSGQENGTISAPWLASVRTEIGSTCGAGFGRYPRHRPSNC